MEKRDLVQRLAWVRIAVGGVMVLAPRLSAWLWAGGGTDRKLARMALRSVGARDIAMGLGLLRARKDREIAAWLEAVALADASDSVATLLGWRNLPALRRLLVISTSAGSAVLEHRLARALQG